MSAEAGPMRISERFPALPREFAASLAGAEGFECTSKNSKPHRLRVLPAASQSNC